MRYSVHGNETLERFGFIPVVIIGLAMTAELEVPMLTAAGVEEYSTSEAGKQKKK